LTQPNKGNITNTDDLKILVELIKKSNVHDVIKT